MHGGRPKPAAKRQDAKRRIRDTLATFAETRERLARLPDDLRLPLTLVMLDGLSYGDAAARLDVPLETLMDRLVAARETLGLMLGADEPAAAAE